VTPSLDDLVLASAQTVAVACQAFTPGDSDPLATLSLAGGSVTADSRRTVMRDCSLEFAPSPGQTLAQIYAILTTPSVELQLSRGFALPDKSTVMAYVGRFIPAEPEWTRDGSGESLSCSGSDVSIKVQRARWTDPYVIVSGTNLAAALQDLLLNRYPYVRLALDSSLMPENLAVQVVTEAGDSSDPWQDAVTLAASFGYALCADPTGIVAAQKLSPAGNSSVRLTFARGTVAIATEYAKSASLERTYNGVIATGEGTGTDTPVRGEAWDDNPNSPTYRYGPFGQVPYFYSSSLMTTADQCEAAAQKLLAGLLGRVEQLTIRSVVHPGLQPLDAISVQQADGSYKTYVVDAVTIPLDVSGTMTVTTREVTVTN
jgi:hypothetical protein